MLCDIEWQSHVFGEAQMPGTLPPKSRRCIQEMSTKEATSTRNRQCRAHRLQNARISCREVNVRSRAYPINISDFWCVWCTFLEFCCGAYVFRYQRLLRGFSDNIHCCCLDPAVPLGTHAVSSWLGACLLPRPQREWKVSGGFAFWRPYLVNHALQ